MDNIVKIDYGSGEWDGMKKARGKIWDNSNRTIIQNNSM